MHAARVGAGFQHLAILTNRAKPAFGPELANLDLVAAVAQAIDGRLRRAAFDNKASWFGTARIKRADEVFRVERWCVNGFL